MGVVKLISPNIKLSSHTFRSNRRRHSSVLVVFVPQQIFCVFLFLQPIIYCPSRERPCDPSNLVPSFCKWQTVLLDHIFEFVSELCVCRFRHSPAPNEARVVCDKVVRRKFRFFLRVEKRLVPVPRTKLRGELFAHEVFQPLYFGRETPL